MRIIQVLFLVTNSTFHHKPRPTVVSLHPIHVSPPHSTALILLTLSFIRFYSTSWASYSLLEGAKEKAYWFFFFFALCGCCMGLRWKNSRLVQERKGGRVRACEGAVVVVHAVRKRRKIPLWLLILKGTREYHLFLLHTSFPPLLVLSSVDSYFLSSYTFLLTYSSFMIYPVM